MKILIILLLFLSDCRPPFVRSHDDCINDKTGEFDIDDCYITLDDVCKSVEGFCSHFKKGNSNSNCLKEITKECKEYDKEMIATCKDIKGFCKDANDECLEQVTETCKKRNKNTNN